MIMHSTFTKEPLHIDDVVVYLKNERTGSSTIRKCKFIGHVLEFTDTKVKVHRLSPPDTFVYPDQLQDLGIDTVCPDDIVQIIISRHQLDNWLCLPIIIGDLTFYNKEELIKWIEDQQKIKNTYQIELKLTQPEAERLLEDMFGSLNIGVLDLSDMSEEEIDRITNE